MAFRTFDAALSIACIGIALTAGVLWRSSADVDLAEALPGPGGDRGYATSDACQACHPDEYATWRASYHRTMTQAATPASVLGTFDVTLEDGGLRWRLERRGDQFWVRMPDPMWFDQPAWLMQALDQGWPDTPPEIETRIVMTTGSHHIQNYWVRRPASSPLGPDEGALVELPWAWLVEEGRWVPNRASFLTPPSDSPGASARWNANCSQCHSVGTEPRISEQDGAFDTRTAELGIACEACHGPADRHVEHYRSPIQRYVRYFRLARGDDPADPTIVNPAKLDEQRAVEVCAQCHSFGEWLDGVGYRREGITFAAGGELGAHRKVFKYEEGVADTLLQRMVESDPLSLEGRFWGDGSIRIAGREYNGFIDSPHSAVNGVTCLSCHSMHAYGSADSQLSPEKEANGACVGCHQEREYVDATGHTRHDPGSAGSECMNCHMPNTTYGLFSAMRSHRIDSPSVSASAETGRPNACNLCHLDRTLAWSARFLTDWYGQSPVELDEDERRVAASVLWALSGDASQRAIVAWHMGWSPAREASGDWWIAPYLAQLLTDPYAATRYVASRSLSTLAGYSDGRYDFTASPAELGAGADRAITRWRARMPRRSDPSLLMTGADIDVDEWLAFLQRRDDRPLVIRE